MHIRKMSIIFITVIVILMSGCIQSQKDIILKENLSQNNTFATPRSNNKLQNITFTQNITTLSQIKDMKIESWAYQLQNADPDKITESGFDLIVIDYSRDGSEKSKYSREDLEKIKEKGIIIIAYLSIGEAEDYRFYWKKDWYSNPPNWLGKENKEWEGNYAVKYWNNEWRSIIFSYLDKIIEQGFAGIYLDKVDEFEYWSDEDNGENLILSEEDAAKRMIRFIEEIAKYTKNKTNRGFYIIIQNGERILEYDNDTLLKIISGWAVEDLFYKELEPLPEQQIRERTFYLDKVKEKGKIILSVDYVDNGEGYEGENKRRIDDYITKAKYKGYIPYAAISDRDLDELNIIEGVQPPL